MNKTNQSVPASTACRRIVAGMVAYLCLAATLPAAADSLTVNINGRLISPTCNINGGTKDFSVTLPPALAGAFIGTPVQERTPFAIKLTGCTGTGLVHAYFEDGSTVNHATGRLKVTGGATNIELRLVNASDGSNIKLGAADGAQNSRQATIVGGNAELSYAVQYEASGGTPTPGAVRSSVMYTVKYP